VAARGRHLHNEWPDPGAIVGAGTGGALSEVKLVLFDIDGTLLWSNGAGRRAMESALVAIFGAAGRPSYRYDGKTDRQIVRELMRELGHADDHIDDRMAAVLGHYLERLELELAAPTTRIRLMDGVRELLGALLPRSDRVSGLLTGNVEPGARRKLVAAGLDDACFVIGAFGSDHEERSELPAVALSRAREHLRMEVEPASMVIIGDTPSDILCGRHLGARAIAVATGHYSAAELARYGPTAVFDDLRDTAAVLQAIDDA
jgi:phosphoglycolate phosphatase-like HAD superfamily hydrolase